MDNNAICLTIGSIQAFVSFYKRPQNSYRKQALL